MWRIMILGLVQGLTEFLPVSSSGHLIVLRTFFGLSSHGAEMEVALHVGTLLAILVGYRNDLLELLKGLMNKKKWARRTTALVIVATIPAVLIGYALEDWISQWFFR